MHLVAYWKEIYYNAQSHEYYIILKYQDQSSGDTIPYSRRMETSNHMADVEVVVFAGMSAVAS